MLRYQRLHLAAGSAGGHAADPVAVARAVLEKSPLLVYCLDLQGRTVVLNHRFRDLTGWDIADAPDGERLLDALYPGEAYRAVVRVLHDNWRENKHVRDQVTTIADRKGAYHKVSWSSARLKDVSGRTVGYIAMGVDVSEEKHLEQWARLQTAVMEQLTEGIAVVNLDGQVVTWTGGALHLLGAPHDQRVGLPADVIYPEGPPGTVTAARVDSALDANGSFDGAVELRGVSGPIRARLRAFLLRNEMGQPIARLYTFSSPEPGPELRDRLDALQTERSSLEARVEELRAEVRERQAAYLDAETRCLEAETRANATREEAEAEVRALSSRLAEAEEARVRGVRELEARHAAELEELADTHSRVLLDLGRSQAETMEEARAVHAAEVDGLQEGHAQSLDLLRDALVAEWEAKVAEAASGGEEQRRRLEEEAAAARAAADGQRAEAEARHADAVAALAAAHAREAESVRAASAGELAALRAAHADELVALRAVHDDEMAALRAAFDAELSGLRARAAADLKEARLRLDEASARAQREHQGQVSSLRQQVETLAGRLARGAEERKATEDAARKAVEEAQARVAEVNAALDATRAAAELERAQWDAALNAQEAEHQREIAALRGDREREVAAVAQSGREDLAKREAELRAEAEVRAQALEAELASARGAAEAESKRVAEAFQAERERGIAAAAEADRAREAAVWAAVAEAEARHRAEEAALSAEVASLRSVVDASQDQVPARLAERLEKREQDLRAASDTARLEAARARADADALVQHLEQVALIALVVTSADGRIQVWSAGAEAATGFRRDQALGRRLHDEVLRIGGLDWAALSHALTDQGHVEWAVAFTDREGSARSARLEGFWIPSPAGHRVVVVLRDAADREALETALFEERAMGVIGRLTSLFRNQLDRLAAALHDDGERIDRHAADLRNLVEAWRGGASGAEIETRVRALDLDAVLGQLPGLLDDAAARRRDLRNLSRDLRRYVAALEASGPPDAIRFPVNEAVESALHLATGDDLPQFLLERHYGEPPALRGRGHLLFPLLTQVLGSAARHLLSRDGERRLSVKTGTRQGHALLEISHSGRIAAPDALEGVDSPVRPALAPGVGPAGLAYASWLARLAGGRLAVSLEADATLYQLELPAAPTSPVEVQPWRLDIGADTLGSMRVAVPTGGRTPPVVPVGGESAPDLTSVDSPSSSAWVVEGIGVDLDDAAEHAPSGTGPAVLARTSEPVREPERAGAGADGALGAADAAPALPAPGGEQGPGPGVIATYDASPASGFGPSFEATEEEAADLDGDLEELDVDPGAGGEPGLVFEGDTTIAAPASPAPDHPEPARPPVDPDDTAGAEVAAAVGAAAVTGTGVEAEGGSPGTDALASPLVDAILDMGALAAAATGDGPEGVDGEIELDEVVALDGDGGAAEPDECLEDVLGVVEEAIAEAGDTTAGSSADVLEVADLLADALPEGIDFGGAPVERIEVEARGPVDLASGTDPQNVGASPLTGGRALQAGQRARKK